MKVISHPVFFENAYHAPIEKNGQFLEIPDRLEEVILDLKYLRSPEASFGEQYLALVHEPEYIQTVKKLSASAEESMDSSSSFFLDNSEETYVVAHTYRVACTAVSASIKAASLATHTQKPENAFALVRPPGHHAHADLGHGFCVFNNIAIAATHLTQQGERVLIVDLDAHHGDGTEEIIRQSSVAASLHYFSIHQSKSFPYTGSEDHQNVTNVAFDESSSEINDKQYCEALDAYLRPLISFFRPSVIAVSAGFDTFTTDQQAYGDALGVDFAITPESIRYFKSIIRNIPYFCVLEGGYHPKSVAAGVQAFLEE